MKKTTVRFCTLLLASILFSSTVSAAIPPIDLRFTCDEEGIFDELKTKEELEKALIKNAAQENLMQVCAYNGMIFALIEYNAEGVSGERTVRGAIYSRIKEKAYRERKSHDFSVVCYIQKSSRARRINYLCYNPTVAAGETGGEEFSFRIIGKKRLSYRRDCTVFFGGLKDKECGKWERVK